MLRLLVQRVGSPSFEHLVEGDEAVLGRSSDSDLVLPDKFTSRRHARIVCSDDGYSIEDLGSHNGTHVNGKQIDRAVAIGDGDVVKLSSFVIFVEEVSMPPAYISASSSSLTSSSGFRPLG
jgi:pSer/pThr/pTyr-binding forkhead associated (FHA) protein